jgi:hypothetical protein
MVPENKVTHFQRFGPSGYFGEDHLTGARCEEKASNDDVNSVV